MDRESLAEKSLSQAFSTSDIGVIDDPAMTAMEQLQSISESTG